MELHCNYKSLDGLS